MVARIVGSWVPHPQFAEGAGLDSNSTQTFPFSSPLILEFHRLSTSFAPISATRHGDSTV
jgi:hypothetical protein